jgi:hypothetical protein
MKSLFLATSFPSPGRGKRVGSGYLAPRLQQREGQWQEVLPESVKVPFPLCASGRNCHSYQLECKLSFSTPKVVVSRISLFAAVVLNAR